MYFVGEMLSNTTTVEQLGASLGQFIDINVQIMEPTDTEDVIAQQQMESTASSRQMRLQQQQHQSIFTVQVRVGKELGSNSIVSHFLHNPVCVG